MRRKLKDGEKYAVLAAAYAGEDVQEGTSVNPGSVGAYRTKTVYAGEFLYISCYPLIGANADRTQRQRLKEFAMDREKCAKLRAKYNKYNNRRRITAFEQLVHANFIDGDLHVCCTYAMQDYEDYQSVEHRTRDEAKADIRNYLRRVKRLLKKCGCNLSEFRWICCTVTKESMKEACNPRPDVHHHHLLMHGVPSALRTDIELLWAFGFCNADRLQDGSEGFSAMAGYIARQEGSANGERAGERSFTTSRNIIKPRVTTSDSRISRRRASLLAEDVRAFGSEIFEKVFPGFRLMECPRVDISPFVEGAYIYARLRRIDADQRRRYTGLSHVGAAV